MKHKTAIFLSIGLVIMAIMLYFIGIDEVIDALKLANFWFIIVAIVVQIITYYLFALRWNIINNTANINTSTKNLLPMVLVGMAINNITPSGRGGGEPVRAYILSKHTEKPSEETFATVIADRALDTFPFLLLAIITIIAMVLYFSLSRIILIILVVSVVFITLAFILLVYMSINQKTGEKITKWLVRIIRIFYKKIEPEILEKKVIKVISGFQKTMKQMLSDKKILYHALPLSFLIWATEIMRVYLVFMAFGANVDPILIGEVFIVASLIGMIPLLPGGLGAVDGVMILLYSSTGISPSISAAATVIERLISFWMTTIIGFLILPHYGSSVLDKISSISTSEEKTAKEMVKSMTKINCESCGTLNEEDSKFCEKCGKPLNQKNITTNHESNNINKVNCPFCGQKIPMNTGKCAYCGEWVDSSKDDSHTGAIVLGYIFSVIFGFLGIIMSIYLLTRGSPRAKKHGIIILILSIILGIFVTSAWAGFLLFIY